MKPTIFQQGEALDVFRKSMDAGKKVLEGPLYDSIDLAGLARTENPATHQLPAAEHDLFLVPVGQVGGGYNRAKRYAECTIEGPGGILPGGLAYIAECCGVYLPPFLPARLKDQLTRHMTVSFKRHTHRWDMGGIFAWPVGELGHQSKAVSTTVAASFVQYGVNGNMRTKRFRRGCELYFPPSITIHFLLTMPESIFVTLDGLTWNGAYWPVPGANGILQTEGAQAMLYLDGMRFEALTS